MRLKHDEATKWVLSGVLLLWALSVRQAAAGLLAVAVAALDIQVLLLWTAFVASLVGAVLTVVSGLAVLLPLQFLPANKVNDYKTNRLRVVAIGVIWALFAMTTLFSGWGSTMRALLALLTVILVMAVAVLSVYLRKFIAKHVIQSLVLPATSAMDMDMMMPNNQRVKARQYISYIRQAAFQAFDLESGGRHGGTAWVNVKMPGQSLDFRIDGAYRVHPQQAHLPPEEQRWVLWFLGNGEVYEMMLNDFQAFSDATQMNIFLFNYRGVSHSAGKLEQAWDLVEDGRACLHHITTKLGARPEHVLLFGHSIGGAVAAQLRADHSPSGPVVLDRSFSSLGAAGTSVFSALCKAILGTELKRMPSFVVAGLLSSVFSGSMDVVAAWGEISGPKLVLYHLEDAIIKYKRASVHAALVDRKAIEDSEAIKLGLDGEAGQNNHHNLPIERFPEFDTIVERCRQMVGLPRGATVVTAGDGRRASAGGSGSFIDP